MDYEKWKYYGQELRRLRDRAGLTQRQLASRAGLSHGMIGALERALRAPKADYSEKFDTILETDGILSRVYRDIEQKRRTTRYLQLPPLLLGAVPEVGG
jgi:transcriptional regulator with XRE-family HTH domain